MLNVKRKVGNIRELSTKGRQLVVVLRRVGNMDEKGRVQYVDVEIPVHHALSASEREQIDAMYPDPLPPRQVNSVTGIPFLDTTDEGWRREMNLLPIKRRDARVVRLLGAEQFGVAEVTTKEGTEAAVAVLRNIEGITVDDIESIDQQGRNPTEITEEGVARKEQAMSPGTPAPPSA